MKRPPTERQAALAARQLHYHRARLGWIRARMRDNEVLLLLYLTCVEAGATVLPGGYRVARGNAPSPHSVAVERLAPACPYEQLELRVGGGESARELSPGEPHRPPTSGLGKPGGGVPNEAARTQEAPAYTERECSRCFGGVVHVGGSAEVRTAPCPDCRGTGKVLCYLYPKPEGRRGPWPPDGTAAEGRRGEDAP